MHIPSRRTKAIAIAIPASIVMDTPHLREKTLKMGLIGRASAIFRVEEIIVYSDLVTDQQRDLNLVKTILSYMVTPQYLKKRIFKITPELEYAGILQPLRTPNHPLAKNSKDLRVGEFREGIVIGLSKGSSLVDIGVEKPAIVHTPLSLNKKLNVKILKVNERVEVALASLKEINLYWGYRVSTSEQPLDEIILKRKFDLAIATSKYGKSVGNVIESLKADWAKAGKILIAFGSPTMGLREILSQRKLRLENVFQHIVNVVEEQGTETIRTEEAVLSSLAILNF
ncbi:MAG: putative RNA uridine N3 methyltransferase [Candidatus Bathyarchaeota archaeon]